MIKNLNFSVMSCFRFIEDKTGEAIKLWFCYLETDEAKFFKIVLRKRYSIQLICFPFNLFSWSFFMVCYHLFAFPYLLRS